MIELLAAWIVVASIVHADVRPALLRLPSIVRLGDISYSVYLVHFPIMCIVAKLMFLAVGDANHIQLAAMLVLFTAVPTFFLADLQYRYVELTGIALGKQLLDALRRRTPLAQPRMSTPAPHPTPPVASPDPAAAQEAAR